jgi:hypothetical protein
MLNSEYSSIGQVKSDMFSIVKDTQEDFRRGAWNGLKGIGIGIWGLAQVGGAYVVTGIAWLGNVKPPDWANTKIEGFKEGFKGIRNPLDFFERMGRPKCRKVTIQTIQTLSEKSKKSCHCEERQRQSNPAQVIITRLLPASFLAVAMTDKV